MPGLATRRDADKGVAPIVWFGCMLCSEAFRTGLSMAAYECSRNGLGMSTVKGNNCYWLSVIRNSGYTFNLRTCLP